MWFKVDGNLAFHPKVVAAGNEAMGLWVRAGAWSCEQMTDGFIPTGIANAMANGMASAMALVMANLWQEVDGGYQFKDWDEFQPSGEEERARKRELSEKRKAAGKKGAAKRWNSKSHSKPMANGMASAIANEWQTDSPDPDPDISTPNGVESMRKPQRMYPEEFERFWSEYPLKRDKGKALRAWKNAIKRADNATLIAGAVRYRNDPNRDDAYTKYAEGWLNGDGWEDEPLPPRGTRPPGRPEPRTFDQMRHDQNLDLWAQIKAEEGELPWPPNQLEA